MKRPKREKKLSNVKKGLLLNKINSGKTDHLPSYISKFLNWLSQFSHFELFDNFLQTYKI